MKAVRMQRLAWVTLLPLFALAGVRDDYAQQWPLTLGQEDAGAYRVVLDRSVYQSLQSTSLQDLDVINADGLAVAAALFDAEQPLAKAATWVDVPWFALPAGNTPQARDIASISEIAADGSLRKVVMQGTDASVSQAASAEFLIDASGLQQAVQALQVSWAAGQAPMDRPYRVMTSDDLKHWRTVQDEARLVELHNNGERIIKDRIELEPVKARYLRLVPLQQGQGALQLSGVRAESVPPAATQAWQWQPIAGKRVVADDGTISFEYEVEGRFPFARADVVLPGNHSSEWTLQSRDDAEAPWQSVAAPWLAFQLQGAAADRSAPQALQGVVRDRYWRLLPKGGVDSAVPTLSLGYRPETVVFLAQGAPPYALVAGSARAQRAEAALPQLVEALRVQRGQHWQPATALLGKPQALAGASALTPAPVQRDWKAWLLWALLIGGALIVAGFAFSLLQRPGKPQQ